MLKRFKVLCGEDLPDDVMPAEFVPTGLEDAFLPTMPTDDQPPLIDDGGGRTFAPTTTPPVITSTTPPATGTTGGGTGGFPTTPIIPTVPTTPISPVPEPGTLWLLAAGSLGLIPVLRRRRTAAADLHA